MRQNGGADYDGVSASGDASLRLIAGGDVAGIDPAMFPEFANVMPSLQAPPHNTVNDVHYGVPYMWGPNFLMYNTDVVKPAPTSWDVVFEADSPYAGKITAYDSPIYIADAALYLKTHNPDLGITDPYELTEEQLNAATDLLKTQAGMVSKYWAIWSDQVDGFDSGDMVVGTAWPGNQAYVTKVPVANVEPERGCHGVGGHVDDVFERPAPELHADVDGLHAPSGSADGGGGVLRRDTVERGLVQATEQRTREGGRLLPLRRRGLPGGDRPVEDATRRVR